MSSRRATDGPRAAGGPSAPAVDGAPAQVVCLGILVADVIVRPVDELPERGTIGLVDSIVLRGGGSALNTSVALARFGVRTTLLGKVGRDPFGDFLVSRFGQPGVDASGVIRDVRGVRPYS